MAVKKSRGLGRGLDALLPVTETASDAALQEIPVADIDPHPDQPRRTFSAEGISALAQSIRDQGVLQPLLVTAAKNGRYTIIAGERRWRAAREAGLSTVPCIIRDMDTIRRMEAALIENLQREDLNPIEEAAGIRALMAQCGYTQETVAQRLGKSRPAVANLLRLLGLPEELQELVRRGDLSAGHARVLAGMDDPERQAALARETIAKGYSVRQLEALAAEGREEQPPKRRRAAAERPAELDEMETRLRETLGMKTTLTGSLKRGRIVLNYYTAEELERLWELLGQLQ